MWKVEGSLISRTMADHGHNKEKSVHVSIEEPKLVTMSCLDISQNLRKNLPSSPRVRQKEGTQTKLMMYKGGIFQQEEDTKERFANRDAERSEIFKKSSSSIESVSEKSQSLIDAEIDQMFKEIFIENHVVRNRYDSMNSLSLEDKTCEPVASASSPRSTKSSLYTVKLRKAHGDKNLELEPVLWQCGSCTSSNSYMSRTTSLSTSSEEYFEDAELPDDFIIFDDFHPMHSDWDSGLSSSNNNSHVEHDNEDEWSLAMSIFESIPREEAIRLRRELEMNDEVPPPYPHRARMHHECQVCLTRCLLRRRVCCDFHICADCMTTYVSIKVSEGKVQIECPNDRCNVLILKDEINDRLPIDMKDKFAKFLVDANADPLKKTCPACSEIFTIDQDILSVKKKKLKKGLKVRCTQCNLYWCFLCQAPFHTEMTCKQFQKGDKMVKKWAKELSAGQSNAQRCPKCKIFIQKVNGCDHMKCSKCNTDFCYRCGDRYINIKLLGNHWSKFSLLGCKYRLMPKRPALRRLIRGANFAAHLVAGVILAGLGLAAGAILVGASVVIVPGYGIFRLRRHLQLREKRKRDKSRQTVGRLAERDFSVAFLTVSGLAGPNEELDIENPDPQQVQVMVHRSVSFSLDEPESIAPVAQDESCEFYINNYTSEGTEMVVSRIDDGESNQVVTSTEVTKIQNPDGYPTVVAHIVSKMAPDKEVSTTAKISGKGRKEGNSDQLILKSELPELTPDKNKNQASDLNSVASGGRTNAPLPDPFLAEGVVKKNIMLNTDDPSCSWENLSGSGKLDSGFGDTESSPESNNSEAKSGSLACDDSDSTKRGNNGCFGNIFSRRIQAPLGNFEYPIAGKSQISGSRKKCLNHKSATWEKCHRNCMQSMLLKSSPLDPVKDFNNLNSIMLKSPMLPLDVADIFSGEMKGWKSAADSNHICDGNSTVGLGLDDGMADIVSWSESLSDDLGKTDSEYSEGQDEDNFCDKFSEHLRDSLEKGDFHTSGCYISTCSEVTHL